MSQQDTHAARGTGRMRLGPQRGEVIDRTRTLSFAWNGRTFSAHPGDTIISALAAAGESCFSRSFKYHRPRGLLTASFHDPGCMVQVDDEPNVRGAHRLVEQGMRVSSQDTWPSLRFDVKATNRYVGRFLSAGFYYKTFMKPEFLWPAYQKVLRRFVHAGAISPNTPHEYYDKRYAHPDVLIAGGGPAGMAAAVAAARAGARVLLVEEEHQLGGHLRWADPAALVDLVAEVHATEGIEVLTNSAVLGRYDDNWIAVVQRNLPGIPERLIKARARTLIVAGGLIERPYVFAGNDTPGVMLSTAARRLINLYAVKPGNRAVVLTANDSGDAAVSDLQRAGVEVVHVADARAGGDILRVHGRQRVTAVELADGRRIKADLLVTATGWTAPTSLLNMAGDVPVYNPRAARFLPGGKAGGSVLAVGGIAGDGTLDQLCEHAATVGAEAARRAATRRYIQLQAVPTRNGHAPAEPSGEETTIPELPVAEHPELCRGKTHGIVDYSEDVSSKDLFMAVREGYDSAELAKRYTTATMGPLQGKLETINAIAVIAEATSRTIAETGTTTWRPMYVPVTLGALAGRIFEPVRHSPMQPWHVKNNAKPLIAGQWIRPDHYGDPAAEVRAVRNGVGIIDVTPIGKLDLRGPDVPKLLNLLYVNKWSNLGIGRVRYGVMCAEDGVVFDDGVTGRLGADHYLMSTTSSGAAAVWEWVENWLQTEHPEWQVHVTPMTTAYASINVAGPQSRELVGRLTEGVDLSPESFGYMNVRTGRVAGVDDCVLWRIGFTGELSYELHVPASYGLHVWEALLEHGKDLGVQPFGMEAQRILRLEKGHLIVGQDTDGLTKAYSAGLDWAVKLDKDDFVGKPELAWQKERGDGIRLVGVQPVDGRIVPPEASQIITSRGKIVGRITSSRMSPTLNRSICLAQVDAALAAPGTDVTVRLPDGRDITARVMPQLAHVDPEGKRQEIDGRASGLRPHAAPVARSPISPGDAVTRIADWTVNARPSHAALTIADYTPLAKIGVRGRHDGALAGALGTRFGRAQRLASGNGRRGDSDSDSNLVIGSGPGEWLVLGDPGSQDKLLTGVRSVAEETGEFASAIDLTHGRAMIRLAGERCADLLAKVCGIDLSDEFTPDGAAFRTSVAKLVTDVVRIDQDGVRGYILHCERSSGQYLFDSLLDAGAGFGIEIDGFPTSVAL
ncbi:FAD-dependent oxidoreductase [Planosporangium flavigriseum]|uniref:Sarcosine oxidase subunit alpha n=1 Tax=Planosporangium flavigriseum TaxID=373681 RepID=A0A8J3LNN3_9ACTN|nr:2Fe-2S iron-sulfur cluster-binding protein [Planosporangium flavigriseum]NJC65526.1 FAD-dependent oxidoreductase [Planosporangium flavigriseum]GIG75037.1 sarcosine oxidase subunit alpha [Planosporangium flavigriseum]